MRVILYAALLARITYGAVTGDYIKLRWHDVVANVDTATSECDGKDTTSINLLRLPELAWDAADTSVMGLDLVGACMGAAATNFNREPGAQTGHSFFFSKSASPGVIHLFGVANYNCGGILAATVPAAINNTNAPQIFGFEGLTANGDSDCGGTTTVTAQLSGGITFASAAGAAGWGVTGTVFLNKPSISANLIGPFDNVGCTGLTGTANAIGTLPITITTETTSSSDAPNANGETAISTTTHQCTSFSNAATNGAQFMVKASLTSTKGQLVLQYTSGAGTVFTTRNNCTMSTTANLNHKLTYTIGLRGAYEYCQQSQQEDGTPQNKYWKLILHPESIGSVPNEVDLPTPAPTAATSPANGLHVSAFMAILIAFITLAM